MKLLCLSNGHGEDAIAIRILEQLQQLAPDLELAALPIVGEGRAYSQIKVPIIGSVKTMPSGGFVYMDGKQLVRDIKGGLLQLTLSQIQTIRHWVQDTQKSQKTALILAVGDLVPLLFAYYSGSNYAFVGTAKSEYYIRNESGLLSRTSWFEQFESWSGSVYVPWERWLMSRGRCQAVFSRDSLTTQVLKRWSIPAYDLGNPMMDGIFRNDVRRELESNFNQDNSTLNITLLPGSREPEAYDNWALILQAIDSIEGDIKVDFWGAIAPSLNLDHLTQRLINSKWHQTDNYCFSKTKFTLTLTQQSYAEYLLKGDLAIAMAGTATEQFIGLGKPAITIPGTGPQFTPQFAEAQTRLLGSSVILVSHPNQVGITLKSLLEKPDIWKAIADNGIKRMGEPGAAKRIAQCLLGKL
jgi:uncharacterized protein (TIGR03492 family)